MSLEFAMLGETCVGYFEEASLLTCWAVAASDVSVAHSDPAAVV